MPKKPPKQLNKTHLVPSRTRTEVLLNYDIWRQSCFNIWELQQKQQKPVRGNILGISKYRPYPPWNQQFAPENIQAETQKRKDRLPTPIFSGLC